MTRTGTVELLTVERRTGVVHVERDGVQQLCGMLPARAVRKITNRLPYTPGSVLLVLEHAFPPVLSIAATDETLPEDAAGPVIGLLAYLPLRPAQART